MKHKLLLSMLIITLITTGILGCTAPPTPEPTAAPTDIPPSETPNPPTEVPTDRPTAVEIPDTPTPEPTAVPLSPTFTPLPEDLDPPAADITVCAAGCDFTRIQAALDSPETPAGAVIEVHDAVHTEANITFTAGFTVTVRGLDAEQTIVQAHAALEGSPGRVFLIEEGADVILSGMTIRHGRPSIEDEHGGGINNFGTLLVQGCIIEHNSARGGGGVSSRTGALTIIGSTVRDNLARGDGPRGEECGGGGGVKCSSGELWLINSTVANNQAGTRSEGLGGGVRTGCSCTAQIVNTTISGNQALELGGGIAAGGAVRITHCTIVQNIVDTGGGALWVRNETNIENTIIANNSGSNCVLFSEGGTQGMGTIGFSRYNLIEGGSCGAAFTDSPMLETLLADNGGSTLTHMLKPGSPAIDAIPAESCMLTNDQRGQPRPAAQTKPDTPCDIGAVEVH